MKLTVTQRGEKKKSEIKEIRRLGNIPAIVYSKARPCETIIIDGTEFGAILREMKPGCLSTTVFSLKDGKKERKAVIKDIQYNITNYRVTHIDFEELVEDVLIQVKIPISLTGVMECEGVKLGGFLRQVIRYVKVECLPHHIPQEFFVDVADLGIKQTRRLSDIALPKGVKPIARLEEVVVVVAKGKAAT